MYNTENFGQPKDDIGSGLLKMRFKICLGLQREYICRDRITIEA